MTTKMITSNPTNEAYLARLQSSSVNFYTAPQIKTNKSYANLNPVLKMMIMYWLSN